MRTGWICLHSIVIVTAVASLPLRGQEGLDKPTANSAHSRLLNAELIEISTGDLQTALKIYDRMSRSRPKLFLEYAVALITLSDLGVDPKANLTKAVGLCSDYRKYWMRLDLGITDLTLSLLYEVLARGMLAALGVQTEVSN